MKASEAVRNVMATAEIGTNSLAERMGKPARLVSDRLSQDNISIDKLNEMLRVLGYKIVIVPREVRCSDGWYVIDNTPSEKTEKKIKLPSIEEQIKSGKLTFEKAIEMGWKPTKEMLDKMLG